MIMGECHGYTAREWARGAPRRDDDASAAEDVGQVVVQGARWRVVHAPWKDCYVVLDDSIPHQGARAFRSARSAIAYWARQEGGRR